ncbi:hypothetical protein T459_24220 [Capsicum annuum]|uniref:NB-ARC domain-containing protein n=1 Tax=Capsicum annuum TaxID=4072 RepID=A0A2G2YUX0_CAPAN|nr:hypothetical protein T459_24220 [Capsicum annuum]
MNILVRQHPSCALGSTGQSSSQEIIPHRRKADGLKVLTSLEAEIAKLAYNAEDLVDSESREFLLAQTVEERSRAVLEFLFVLERALGCSDSTMKQWMATLESIKSLKVQTYSLVGLPEHAVERPQNMMVGYETEFDMILDQLASRERERKVVSIVGMEGIGKTTLATKLYSDPRIMPHF